MISHDRAQELISARMDAPLTPAEHHELQGHLATCTACRVFVTQADDIARDLQVMPRLAASPMVSRTVMAAITADPANAGWGWLRHGLQALSSPGMAVASSMALVLALAGALFVALNAPGGNNPGTGVTPEGTIAAMAPRPLPTEEPTEAPAPTQAAAESTEAPDNSAEPTATQVQGRSIEPKPTEAPKTPTPRPTATSVPIINTSGPIDQPEPESPPIEPAGETIPAQTDEAPALAMAGDEAPVIDPSAEMAQAAEPVEAPADSQEIVEEPVAAEGEAVDPAPAEGDGEVAPAAAEAPEGDDSGSKDNRRKDEGKVSEEPAEPLPTRQAGPLPAEAIAALKGVGTAPDIVLPPAPLDPLQPDQSFLPVTPTPVTDGTPTPESEQASGSEAPQLAEDWSGDLGVTALAPEEPADEAPVVAEAPDESTSDSRKEKDKGKRDKDSSSGKSHEQQQSAFVESPMAWSSEPIDLQGGASQPVELQQTADQPVAPEQTTEYPVDASSTSGSTTEVSAVETPAPELQIDPATGFQIDPATGYLIDPTTGYLLDREHGRVVDPRTGYEVHPGTGLLIDPATGAQLDPNTLEVVIPPGFGTDTPDYNPGSPEMRGSIETVVDDTYNNASIRMEPATDGPVQPIGEIVVPTESGDAVEIS